MSSSIPQALPIEAPPRRRDVRRPAVSQPGIFASRRSLLAFLAGYLTLAAIFTGSGIVAGYLIWGVP